MKGRTQLKKGANLRKRNNKKGPFGMEPPNPNPRTPQPLEEKELTRMEVKCNSKEGLINPNGRQNLKEANLKRNNGPTSPNPNFGGKFLLQKKATKEA